jgi:hypothetical protein
MAVICAINEGAGTWKWGDIKNISRILKNIEVMFQWWKHVGKKGVETLKGEKILDE